MVDFSPYYQNEFIKKMTADHGPLLNILIWSRFLREWIPIFGGNVAIPKGTELRTEIVHLFSRANYDKARRTS